jgi:hypothetical protein
MISDRKPVLLSSAVLLATLATGALAPTSANACTCVASAMGRAGATATLVGTGAAAISTQMYLGFESVAGTVTGSTGQQTKQIVDSLELMTKTIAKEVRDVPKKQQEMERRLDTEDPARQASDACTYTDRAGDLSSSTSLASLQAERLNESSSSYNAMTSSYPDQVDKGGRFAVQTFDLLKNRPEVEQGGLNILTGPDKFGALSPDEVQEAATFINLTTNPNPPAQINNVTNQAAINQNVEADLYNMRMTYPQAVQNQLLSYESPIMTAEDDSWLADTLSSMTPYAQRMIDEAQDGVSYNDLLKIMATHRLKSPLWLANLANKDESGAIKDLALAKADSMLMDYEIWKQDKNTALLMSQLLASLNRQERK